MPVEQRDRALLRRLIADVRDRVEPHAAAVRQRDRQPGEVVDRGDGAGGADGLLEAADASLAARVLGLDAPQLPGDVARGGAERGHSIRIEIDANLAIHAADPAHAPDAGHGGEGSRTP